MSTKFRCCIYIFATSDLTAHLGRLVGKNGAGKTTLLRVLAGDLIPNQGDIVKSPSTLTTAILRQEFVDELVGERTLKEEFLQTFEKERQILRELEATQKELEAMSPDEDPEIMQAALDRLQDMHTRVDESKLKALESNVMKMMHLMGFNDDEADDLVSSFSGGWKMRIGLGKVLLRQPNILFLDEPTNHLGTLLLYTYQVGKGALSLTETIV